MEICTMYGCTSRTLTNSIFCANHRPTEDVQQMPAETAMDRASAPEMLNVCAAELRKLQAEIAKLGERLSGDYRLDDQRWEVMHNTVRGIESWIAKVADVQALIPKGIEALAARIEAQLTALRADADKGREQCRARNGLLTCDLPKGHDGDHKEFDKKGSGGFIGWLQRKPVNIAEHEMKRLAKEICEDFFKQPNKLPGRARKKQPERKPVRKAGKR